MMVKQNFDQSAMRRSMSAETIALYRTLTPANQQKVIELIATLLNQQSNDLQSSDSQM